MSAFRDLAKTTREIIAPTTLSCIPQIISKDPFDYAKEIIRSEIITNRLCTKITIIDPYVNESDIYILAEIYGGYSDLHMEVVTKFESHGNESETDKQKRKIRVGDAANFLCRNRFFQKIDFFHSTEQMHDRYLIAWHGNDVKRIFLIGGSIGQKFGQNTCIIRLENLRMQSLVLIYLRKMKDNLCA